MYWYIILAVFALNIVWAARNWKSEWDEMIWAWKECPIALFNKKVFRKALFSKRVILAGLVLGFFTTIFPPIMFITGIMMVLIYASKVFSFDVVKISSYPLIATFKFVGDLAITTGATAIFGFSGLFGSAMAIFFSNVLSVTFFTPGKNHNDMTLSATDDFSDELKEYDERILNSNKDIDDIFAKYGFKRKCVA